MDLQHRQLPGQPRLVALCLTCPALRPARSCNQSCGSGGLLQESQLQTAPRPGVGLGRTLDALCLDAQRCAQRGGAPREEGQQPVRETLRQALRALQA